MLIDYMSESSFSMLMKYFYQNQDRDWEGVDSEEEDDSDNELDMSDEDDSYYAKKPKSKQRGKVGHIVKSTRERKSYQGYGRQRRGKSSLEDDESSAEGSESDSDEGFKSTRRKGAHLRKSSGRSTLSTNVTGRNSEVRTSSRSVRKVSYVESEESEDVDESKKKKSQKVRSSYLHKMMYLFSFCCSDSRDYAIYVGSLLVNYQAHVLVVQE